MKKLYTQIKTLFLVGAFFVISGSVFAQTYSTVANGDASSPNTWALSGGTLADVPFEFGGTGPVAENVIINDYVFFEGDYTVNNGTTFNIVVDAVFACVNFYVINGASSAIINGTLIALHVVDDSNNGTISGDGNIFGDDIDIGNSFVGGTFTQVFWDGSYSTEWTDTANWSKSVLPISTDWVWLNLDSAIHQPIITTNATIKGLFIVGHQEVTIASSGSLTLD
ncbi:MAG: hypothetical protein GQ525_02885, partial [Draconibacterium sp.]|nr:hypothetical protein [Draconibacterium sp.]